MQGYLDHHTWLVSSNLFTEEMKDHIAMGGYCLLENVKDVSTSIDFNTKIITYHVLIPQKLYDRITLLNKFEKGENIGIFEYLKLKAFIRSKRKNDESGMGYRLKDIGNRFIKNYLNKEWSVEIKLFKEGKDGEKDFWLRDDGDKSSN